MRKKSSTNMEMELTTTAWVVDRPTPTVPPVVESPMKQPTIAMVHPKKKVFAMPDTTSSTLTVEMIDQVNATKVFLGADGLSLSAGLTTPNLEIAMTERAMIRRTRGKVIVLADHTKFGLVAEVVITPVKNIDVIITDRQIPEDVLQDLTLMNI